MFTSKQFPYKRILASSIFFLLVVNIICQVHAKFIEPTALEQLVDIFHVYDVYDADNNKLKFVRHGRKGDGGYVVPEVALAKSDVLLGYGIADDISFEEYFSNIYNKPSFGFDCGVESIKIENKLCSFVRECIANDKYLYGGQQSSNLVSSFPEQIKKLNLVDQKFFIKMDIEGAEYDAFEDIYKHAVNITGIVLEIHFGDYNEVLKAQDLITRLKQNFYLVHVHANNCAEFFTVKNAPGKLNKVVELTFINKSLVHKAHLSQDQSFPKAIDMPNCPRREDAKFRLEPNLN